MFTALASPPSRRAGHRGGGPAQEEIGRSFAPQALALIWTRPAGQPWLGDRVVPGLVR